MEKILKLGLVAVFFIVMTSNISACPEVIIHKRPPVKARVVVVKPVRPHVIMVRPAKLRPNYIWIEGHWKWNRRHHRYLWVKGRTARKQRNKIWIAGHWTRVRSGWYYVQGHWA